MHNATEYHHYTASEIQKMNYSVGTMDQCYTKLSFFITKPALLLCALSYYGLVFNT